MTRLGHSHARRGGAQAEFLEPRTLLAASLVADVQQGSADAAPSVLAAGPERLYFRAFDGSTVGNEPYTFTPAAGAALLKDVNPEGDSIVNNFGSGLPPPPTPAVAAGNGFYFAAYDRTYGLELYYTDGTAAGTRLVKDVHPGPGGANPDQLFVAGDTLHFVAEVYTPQTGVVRGLWKTDGTDVGTVAIRHVSNGAALQAVGSMAVLDGAVYGITTNGLYRIDPGGAVLVKGLSAVNSLRSLTAFGGALYFKYGTQLWRSDGTEANTVPLATIGPISAQPQTFDGLRPSGGALYFATNSGGLGTELWRSDGTAEGTRLVKDLNPGLTSSWPNHLTDVDGTLYFSAGAAGVGEALWKSDGTEAGTVPVVSLVPDVNPATRPIFEVVSSGGKVFFAAAAPAGVVGLWASDGTTGGTARVSAAPEVKRLTLFNGQVYFSARSIDGSELWSSDGTAAGTRQVQDINARHSSTRAQPEGLAEINGRVVFASDDGVTGRKLWSSDGTAGGTIRLMDFPKPHTALAFRPVRLGNRLYFPAGNTGADLMTTDGTAAGTYPVRSFLPNTQAGGIGRLASVAGMLLFFADDGTVGRELWTSDGTPDGTRLLKDMVPGTVGSTTSEEQSWPLMVEAGGLAWFMQDHAIWKTDGTPEGTVAVRVFTTSGPNRPVALGNRVIFTLPYSGSGPRDQLWVTDGTPEGTTLLREDFVAHSFAALNDFVLFWGSGGLWRSDGTPEGTYAVVPYNPGGLRNPTLLTPWNGAIYFRSDTGIWKTDGTTAGTKPLLTAEGHPAALAGSGPFMPLGDHLYFPGADADHGSELWRTDGTDAGTVRLADVLPGRASSLPTNLVARGDTVYFFADDGVNGRELWRYDAGAPVVTVGGRHVFYNHSAFDGGDAGATFADLGAVAPDKQALLPGGTTTFSNVTSYTRGINGVLVDFAGVPPQTLTGTDFDFRAGRAGDEGGWGEVSPAAVTHLVGPTGAATGRYAITFPDFALRNTWLRVTVKANANTGLAAPDVFYFGNLVGDAGVSPLRVDMLDYVVTRRSANGGAGLSSRTDFDRNGRVNAIDVTIARVGAGRSLSRLAPPAPVAPVGAVSLRRRSVWVELL